MAAPAVRDLNALVKQIGQSVAGQKGLIDADIKANDQSGQAQVAGLAAKKDQTFGEIEQAAQDKNMLFSGFTPDEQAKYTSTTYLPALAALQATIAQTRSSLLGKKADIDTNVFNKAFDTREGDIGRRFSWQERQDSQAFTAKQSQLQREFDASESAKDRAAAAANAASSNTSNAASLFDADRKGAAKDLSDMAGGDGKVSPSTWNKIKNQWVGSGYDAGTFNKYFGQFINTGHAKDYK